MKHFEIIPAVLSNDFAELQESIGLVSGLVRTVQIDVCDGHFTPKASWPYRRPDEHFESIIRQEEGLPHWQELDFEIDLLADHPEKLVEDWVSAGVERIIIHVESKGDLAAAIASLDGRVSIGLALNKKTPPDILEKADFGMSEGKISFIQIMGIERIGFQGQPFDDETVGRVRQMRLKYPVMPISVDGGVSLDNAPALLAAGADRLVAGSAIFWADDIRETIAKFKSLH